MLAKMSVLFAIVGISSASIVLVNVYDDEAENKREHINALSCDFSSCNQDCYRHGLPGGMCFGNECKCHTWPKEGLDVIRDIKLLKSCDPLHCDQTCHRIFQKGGACVKDRCKCDIRKSDLAEKLAVEACSLRACEQLCRRLGFPGGACVNGKCDCDRFKDSDEPLTSGGNVLSNDTHETKDTSVTTSGVKDCSLRACEQLCRRLGFPGGVCVNGKCDCDRFKEIEFRVEGYCTVGSCNEMCQKLNYVGGSCKNGYCTCY